MEILQFSFNGVAPICLLMLLGYGLCHGGFMTERFAQDLNRFAYYVLIPCNLFLQVVRADLQAVFDPAVVAVSLGGMTAVMLVSATIAHFIVPRGHLRGEFVQGVFRGNTAILGIPLITNLYGNVATGVLAFPMTLVLVYYNVVAPVMLAVYAGTGQKKGGDIVRQVSTNPFLIGVVAGIAVSLLSLPIPTFLSNAANSLGTAGSSMALVALGATTDVRGFRKGGKIALLATFLRLVVFSSMVLAVGILLGLRAERLAVLVCFFSTPTAVGSYVLARNVDGDGELSKQILILTTIASMFTMFLTLLALRALGVM